MSSAFTSPKAGSPDRPGDPAVAVRALLKQGKIDEAEAAIGAALANGPARLGLLQVAAAVAEQRGDLQATLARWAEVCAAAPDDPAGFIGALRSLRRRGRLDLADPIMREGRDRLWDNLEFVVMAAQVATATKKIEETEQAWQRATELAPDNPEYALSYAMAQVGPRKGRRKRLRIVAKQLDEHHKRFPAFVPAYTAHVDVLREMRRLPDADRLSAKWCARFATDIKLALARIGVVEELGRADDALAEVNALRARAPDEPEVAAAHIRVLSCAGRHADAESACAEARLTWPKDRLVWLEYARIASRQGDWTECVRRLEEARALRPKDEAIVRELRTVRAQLAEPEAAPASPPAETMFTHFESLGGTGIGCEFAMVQRRLGTDSLGLLRWAHTYPPAMIAALDAEFEGVGDEANTGIGIVRVSADREEYTTLDKRFEMESHTFVRTTDAPQEQMFKQACRRLRFLRGKLLEVLQTGGKIFVYRAGDPVDDATIVRIHESLARYGRNALLCVMRVAGTPYEPRTLRVLGDGIYVGYVNHLLNDPGENRGSDIEGWSALCAKALQIWQATGVASGGENEN